MVLENKYYPLLPKDAKIRALEDKLQFICSGTIAREYGVFEAIGWFKEIERMIPGSTLTIIGHCPNLPTYNQVIEQTELHASIYTDLSKTPLPHTILLKAMKEADVLLLPYRLNKSTELCVPTKLFEALALKLPVIISDNKLWSALIKDVNAGISLDFMTEKLDYNGLTQKLFNSTFYNKKGQINPFWYTEEPKLLEYVQKILKD